VLVFTDLLPVAVANADPENPLLAGRAAKAGEDKEIAKGVLLTPAGAPNPPRDACTRWSGHFFGSASGPAAPSPDNPASCGKSLRKAWTVDRAQRGGASDSTPTLRQPCGLDPVDPMQWLAGLGGIELPPFRPDGQEQKRGTNRGVRQGRSWLGLEEPRGSNPNLMNADGLPPSTTNS
jgi:hypothetical protein